MQSLINKYSTMRRLLHLTLFVLFLPLLSSAANRHWVGTVFPPGVSTWNNIANWSATLGGPGGASVPGAADIAIFRSTNATPTGYFIFFADNITVQEIQISRTGTGAVPNITFSGNVTLTGPGGVAPSQPALTLTGNNAGTLNFTGNLTIQGDISVGNGAIVNSTLLTTINNNTRATSVATAGTGVINMQDLTVNTGANAMVLGASNNFNTANQFVVNGLLTLQSGAINSLGTGTSKGELRVGGNIVGAAGFLASNANLKFIGSTNQSVTLAAGTQSNWNGNVFLAVDPAPVDENGDPLPIATVTLNSPFILDATGQSITFTQGVLNTTAVNYLGLGAGVTAIGASNASYVDGFVRKRGTEAFTFPTGDAGFYAPIHMAGNTGFTDPMPLNPGGLAPNYAARYLRENPQVPFPNNAPQPTDGNAIPTVLTLSIQEYFIFDFVSDIPGFPPTDFASANMPYLWLSYENLRSGGIAQPTSVAVIAWLTNRWENLSNGGLSNVGGIDYLRMNTRAFSAADNNPVYSFGTNNPLLNPLPVAWLDFTGRRAGSSVELAWKTASEKDNDKFTVERSADGKNFSALGTVAGNGSTELASQYTFSDKAPLSTIGVYRIKQTDLNGKFSYSKEIRVAGLDGSITGIRLYPNPAPTSATLYLENATWRNQKVKVTIINALGAVVREEQISFSGDSRAKVNISGIQRGSYYMSTQVNGEKKVVPFIIQ